MDALDRTFRISLVLKGLDGILELVGGVLLLLVTPTQINSIARLLTQHELSEDPRDFIANHVLNAAGGLTTSATLFGAIYLLWHGLVKVMLVVAVLRDKLWAYPLMIGFLAIFIVYQIYQIALMFSVGLSLLTGFDVFIVCLTIVEFRRRRAVRRRRPADSA